MRPAKVCKQCKKEFQNRTSDCCSIECEKDAIAQILQEEKAKLLEEVKKKIKQKKAFMKSDGPETNDDKPRFRNITYEKRNSKKS